MAAPRRRIRLWRQLAGYAAAYAVALQVAFSGLAIIAQAASAAALPVAICSEHPADRGDNPSQPLDGHSLCPCACTMTGCGLVADAPRIPALGNTVAFAATLSRCGSPATPKHPVRAPQIPRAPPTI